jgi:hypothetical protein
MVVPHFAQGGRSYLALGKWLVKDTRASLGAAPPRYRVSGGGGSGRPDCAAVVRG